MDKTYYQILGVSQEADGAAIKDAFRKLAKKYHPDTNPDDVQAEKMFKDVNEAYSVLSDAGRRAKYDRDIAQTAETNPFKGFGHSFDFDACMGAGMKYQKSYTESKKQTAARNAPDFMNVNAQFSRFFGFSPKK